MTVLDAVGKIADLSGVGVAFGQIDRAGVAGGLGTQVRDRFVVLIQSAAAVFIGQDRVFKLKTETGCKGIGSGRTRKPPR